jgi:hypothetical protein
MRLTVEIYLSGKPGGREWWYIELEKIRRYKTHEI